jgi:hypothetical protein
MSAASDLICAPPTDSHGTASSARIGGSGASTSLKAVPSADGGIVTRGYFISGHLQPGYMQNFRQAA